MKVLCICSSSTVSASLPDFIIFFIIYHIHKLESAQFRVMGPGHPVTAIVGENIVLPCHLSPRMSAENMEVRWFRSEFTSVVHQYHEGKDQYGEQMPDYHERTELLKAGITDGNVSLQILNISRSDEGQYSCFVQDGSFYEEALLELKVAALGSNPLISVESHQDGGIRVVCQSAGWYPEPKVLWRDPSGQELPSLSEAKSLGDSGLFETENSIIIKENSNQNLSCWIRNTVLNQEKESTVYIAGQLPAKPHTLKSLPSETKQNTRNKELKHLLCRFYNLDTNKSSETGILTGSHLRQTDCLTFEYSELSEFWVSCQFNLNSDTPETLILKKKTKDFDKKYSPNLESVCFYKLNFTSVNL